MHEYKFIIEAMDSYLCEQLTAVICMENFTDNCYPHGYRKIFDEYIALRKQYKLITPETFSKCKEDWKLKQETILNSFVDTLNSSQGDINITSQKDNYLNKMSEEDIPTLGKRIGIYPYLVLEARKKL